MRSKVLIFVGLALALVAIGCGEDKESCEDVVKQRFERYVRDTCLADPEELPTKILDCQKGFECEEELDPMVNDGTLDTDEEECICRAFEACRTGIDRCYTEGHVDPDDLYY